jgi:hypothetical protein
MSDDRPPAPTYGPPITIPSGEILGRIAYHAWFEAYLSRPAVDWMELSEALRTAPIGGAGWQQAPCRVVVWRAGTQPHALRLALLA